MSFIKHIFIQRFTIFDMCCVVAALVGLYQIPNLSVTEWIVFMLGFILVGGVVSVTCQLALGTKIYNGWTDRVILKMPRY